MVLYSYFNLHFSLLEKPNMSNISLLFVLFPFLYLSLQWILDLFWTVCENSVATEMLTHHHCHCMFSLNLRCGVLDKLFICIYCSSFLYNFLYYTPINKGYIFSILTVNPQLFSSGGRVLFFYFFICLVYHDMCDRRDFIIQNPDLPHYLPIQLG